MPPARRLAALLLGGAVLLTGCTTPAPTGGSTSAASSGRSTGGSRSTSGAGGARHTGSTVPPCDPGALPAEVPPVLAAISAGGPFRHPRNDGVTFGNRERLLPQARRGYYREYTVDTPGARTRGERRVITGGDDARRPEHRYYTGDHYDSFCEITEP